MNKTDTIPKMKKVFQDGKIAIDEYNTELKNLKYRLEETLKKMNAMQDR